MHACGLSLKYWTHAVAYVVHTLNHIPNRVLDVDPTTSLSIWTDPRRQLFPDFRLRRVYGTTG